METTDGLMLLNKSSMQSEYLKVTLNGKLTDFIYNINSVYEDSDSKLWIGTDEGLFLLIEENDNYRAVDFLHQANNPNSLSGITSEHDELYEQLDDIIVMGIKI